MKIESCDGETELFKSESCQPVNLLCTSVEPISFGKTIQNGSEELSVVTWYPGNLRDGKVLRIKAHGETFEIALSSIALNPAGPL